MLSRRLTGAILALCVIAAGRPAGWRAVLPMTVAVLGVLVVAARHDRSRIVVTVAVVVAVSSALGTLSGDPAASEQATGVATLVEIAGLLLLVGLVARYAEIRRAVVLGIVLGVLASTALLRLQIPPTVAEAAAQSAFFALGAVAAAATGGGLRHLETRRLQAVREARRRQRLELAADVHDFVAHEVSGMVTLAQAALMIAGAQPEKVRPLLQQIEAGGRQALGSMDRAVGALQSSDAPAADETHLGGYGLDDIVDVVDRFRADGRAEVRLIFEVPPEQLGQVPRAVAGMAHRVVVEALTNVRRHAGRTPWVTVAVMSEPVLTVSVTNGSPSAVEAGGHFGDRGRHVATGLERLAERVRALEGTLEFGVHGTRGWRVTAVLPVG